MIAPLRAVLFDLDGTLHDRNATIRRWLARHVARFGLPDDFGYRSKREVFPALISEFGLKHSPDELFADFCTALEDAQAMSHAQAVLTELRARGVRVGVVTNGWEDAQRQCLEVCGLAGQLDDVVISRAVGLSKPDPAIYRLALDRLGAEADHTWFIGDSPRNDVWGPQQVGLRAAWLPTGHRLGAEVPDAVLADLRGVLALDRGNAR